MAQNHQDCDLTSKRGPETYFETMMEFKLIVLGLFITFEICWQEENNDIRRILCTKLIEK